MSDVSKPLTDAQIDEEWHRCQKLGIDAFRHAVRWAESNAFKGKIVGGIEYEQSGCADTSTLLVISPDKSV